MIMETRIEEDIVNSDIIIWDCANLTIGHIMKYIPIMLKKSILFWYLRKKNYFLYI